ncbi:MAG TPA: hypothetical protein VMU15_22010 [Anaeromyxobacter sp.]|nr:hypothetical protein [Anaeromyxobacter sp.]
MSEPVKGQWAEGELSLEARQLTGEVRVTWRGRSSDREPGRFLLPVLSQLVESCRRSSCRLCLDFAPLEYMNSSTFTPVVKAIDEARRAGVPIALEYSQAKKWQALSFSALRTFETADGSVTVLGR